MKTQIATLVLTFLCIGLFSQEKYLSDVPATQALSKKVAELFVENKISKAFNEMRPYWPVQEDEVESVEEKSLKLLNILEDRYGNTISAVKVNNQTIADFAVRETYLVRYNMSAIRLVFTYFKTDSGWIINAFKWDDSFSEEFD